MAKSFFDFRKTLSEDVDYSLKDLVYYNEDALKESMDKVEQYDQKHFKDGWQSIELTPPPENDSQETKEELQEIIDEQTTRTKDDENSIYVSDFMESFHFREYLNVSEKEVIKRLTARGRKDDKPEIIKNRLKVYEKETGPVLDKFRQEKNKFIEIKAEGKDPETISADIIGAIEDRG